MVCHPQPPDLLRFILIFTCNEFVCSLQCSLIFIYLFGWLPFVFFTSIDCCCSFLLLGDMHSDLRSMRMRKGAIIGQTYVCSHAYAECWEWTLVNVTSWHACHISVTMPRIINMLRSAFHLCKIHISHITRGIIKRTHGITMEFTDEMMTIPFWYKILMWNYYFKAFFNC